MSKQSFEEVHQDLSVSIYACFESRLILSGLILLYSGIDIMAWLNRPKNKPNSNRKDFMNWVDNYLLPNSKLKYNSSDLYGARCSILHSATAESALSRKGKALKVYYVWGNKKVDKLQGWIDITKEQAIVIRTGDLLEAFQNGFQCFKQVLLKDNNWARLVYKRADKCLIKMLSLPELPK